MTGAEAVGLRWQDINLDEMEIEVNHSLVYYPEGENHTSRLHVSTPKTEAGTRVVPMLEVVKEAFILEKEMQLEDGGLNKTVIDGMKGFIFKNRFGSVPNPQTINDAIERIRNEYNKIETLNAAKEGRTPLLVPHFSCHHMRHTFTQMLHPDVTKNRSRSLQQSLMAFSKKRTGANTVLTTKKVR